MAVQWQVTEWKGRERARDEEKKKDMTEREERGKKEREGGRNVGRER